MQCMNCQRVHQDRLRVGRCMSCYRYYLRHGHDRPPGERIRSPKQPRPWCSNCKHNLVGTRRSLCDRCYQYKHRTGKNRPWHRWTEKCKVCARPRREDKQDGFVKGRCRICAVYRYKTGRDRSPELVARTAPHGWCDCGQPAVTVLTVDVQQHQETLPLCAECHAIEQADASNFDLNKSGRLRGVSL
jgi:hypothetical protein